MKYKSGDAGYISTIQGMPRVANKPPEARREAWDRISLTALRISTSSLQNSETVCLLFKAPGL